MKILVQESGARMRRGRKRIFPILALLFIVLGVTSFTTPTGADSGKGKVIVVEKDGSARVARDKSLPAGEKAAPAGGKTVSPDDARTFNPGYTTLRPKTGKDPGEKHVSVKTLEEAVLSDMPGQGKDLSGPEGDALLMETAAGRIRKSGERDTRSGVEPAGRKLPGIGDGMEARKGRKKGDAKRRRLSVIAERPSMNDNEFFPSPRR